MTCLLGNKHLKIWTLFTSLPALPVWILSMSKKGLILTYLRVFFGGFTKQGYIRGSTHNTETGGII